MTDRTTNRLRLLLSAVILLILCGASRISAQTLPRHAQAGAACAVDAVAEEDRICLGDSLRLHASGDGTFVWSPATFLSCATCPDPVARPTTSTMFTVTATTSDGCTAVDSVFVIVNALPWAYAGADTTLCIGDSVFLEAIGGVTFVWEPTAGLSCITCSSLSAKPEVTTRYILTTANVHGCIAYDTVLITVVDQPIAEAGPDIVICGAGSAQLHASGGNRYRWSPPAGLSCDDCPDPVATPAATTTYRVAVSTGPSERCIAFDSVTVTVVDDLDLILSGDTAICAGDSVKLSAAAAGAISYTWSPPAGLSCADCPDPVARPATTTTYRIVASTGQSERCVAVDSLTVTVLSEIELRLSPDTMICAGDSVRLSAGAAGAETYTWSPADGLSCSDCPAPVARPARTTTYSVIVASGDCSAAGTTTVVVDTIPRAATLRITGGLRVAPGDTVRVPLVLETELDGAAIDLIELAVESDSRSLMPVGLSLAGTRLDGWSAAVTRSPGALAATLRAPAGGALKGAGVVAELVAVGYIAERDSATLTGRAGLPGERCAGIVVRPGTVLIDSLCGLALRLIEITAANYALLGARPNPFNPTTTIEFTIGLDGPTEVLIRDRMGNVVARLLDAHLDPGRYEVVWDGTALPSGLYYCTLASGAWSSTLPLLLVK